LKEEIRWTWSIVWNSNTWILNLSWSVQNKKEKEFNQEDLERECQKIIDWEKSEYLDKNKWILLNEYKKAQEFIDENEYQEGMDILNWKCENVKDINKDFCNIYKTRDLSKLSIVWEKWTYKYILLKSLIEGKNNCKDISLKELEEDCNRTYKNFLEVNDDLPFDKYSILDWDSFNNWKYIEKYWKEKYLDLLQEKFLNKCISD